METVELTKQQVMAQINNISDMDYDELEEYSRKVSVSNADDKAKYYIYKAIDERKEQLSFKDSAIVVDGDISDMAGAFK